MEKDIEIAGVLPSKFLPLAWKSSRHRQTESKTSDMLILQRTFSISESPVSDELVSP